MEDVGILDADDEIDLYTLYYIFIPIIQKQIDLVKQAWACHPLRTERNRSQQQLWILGLHATRSQAEQHKAVTGPSVVSHNIYTENVVCKMPTWSLRANWVNA